MCLLLRAEFSLTHELPADLERDVSRRLYPDEDSRHHCNSCNLGPLREVSRLVPDGERAIWRPASSGPARSATAGQKLGYYEDPSINPVRRLRAAKFCCRSFNPDVRKVECEVMHKRNE
jgi:hypothetical protein